MDNEYEADLITLIDDEDNEHRFEIIDSIEKDDTVYYALYPVYDTPEEQIEADGEYYIFEVIDEDGEDMLQEVEDDDLLNELSKTFEERFADAMDDSESDED